MRFGVVILPQYPWPEARRLWRSAEQLGFDHAWTYDHLAWRSLAGEPWGATVPTLTAAALVTERIRLGTFVTSPNFRHPVPFAKDLATLDELAGGRLTLGIGSGTDTGFDARVLGQPPYSARQRHERFAEFVELLDALLRFEQTDSAGGALAQADVARADGVQTHAGQTDAPGIHYAGRWFTAVGARMVGAPAQSPRVPFAIAANGPKGLELAARHGQGWITTGPSGLEPEQWWARIAELSSRLDETDAAAGRDPGSLDRYLSYDALDDSRFALSSLDAFEDAAGRAQELGFTELVIHWPRADGVYAGEERVLEEASALFARYRQR